MSDLRLFLLGSPHIEHAGSPVRIDRRKALALLAYLAVTGSSHHRDALATLLWPDCEASRAYAYLRNALWVLRQTPVGEWLAADRETLGLKRGAGLWLDVEQFRGHLAACQTHDHPGSVACAACRPLLVQAVDLYRDDFMAGFTLSDCIAFDEWQFFQAETLRQELAGALEKLVRLHEREQEFEPAIAYARHWLALDPLHEPVQRQLMTLYARSGQRAAALRQYDECVRTLKEGLGLAPSGETVERYRRILAGELGAVQEQVGAAVPLHNLPDQAMPFVGREPELAELRQLLADPACRLLTLTGLGGSGKTRLALQAAMEAALQAAGERVSIFPDGVFFVPLAPVSGVEFMTPAIVDALRVPLSQRGPEVPSISPWGSEALQAQFLDYLRGKRMLLVLDNIEHLLEGVDLIGEILRSAPDVKLLLTSRERLNLRREWVLEIAGLRFPTKDTAADAYGSYSAVQLFLQSARHADAGFSPTAADVAAVARICQLVEGVPLAIELASTWVKVLSCEEIAAEIEANLDFLTTSLRDVPKRHRSLRAVFAQSWALLSRDGRACFRKLAVFRGGFTREAAKEVAGASLAALSSLIDKSLLRRTPAGRYEMHELLRQYAEERLDAVPRESDLVRDRHCTHYLALLRRLETSLKGRGQKAALDTLRQEVENVRLAWRWAAARGRVKELQGAASSLFLFYDIRSRFQEGADMFREAAAALSRPASDLRPVRRDTEDKQALLGLLLAAQGWFVHFHSFTEARELFERSLEHLEPLGRRKELAFAYVASGFSRLWRSYEEAKQRLQASLAIYEAAEDHWGIALTLEALADLLGDRDPEIAERYAQRSLDLRRQIGDRWGIALALYILGWVAERRDRLRLAKRRYRESIDLRRDMGEDLAGIVGGLLSSGRVARKMKDYGESRRLYRESLALSREIGNRWRAAQSLESLGHLAYELGEFAKAKLHFAESLALYEELGAKFQVASVNEALGNVDRVLEDYEQVRDLSPVHPHAAALLIEPLSKRELEVLQLLATGLSNREIAETLFISVGTVKNHLKSIYRKLDVHNRTRAVHRAIEIGIL